MYIYIYILDYTCQLQYTTVKYRIKISIKSNLTSKMPRWCAEIYGYSIGNCRHLVVGQYPAVWTNATEKLHMPSILSPKIRSVCLFPCIQKFVCTCLYYMFVFICVLIPCGANQFRNGVPVLLNCLNSEPKYPQRLVVARGNAKPNPNWHKCRHEQNVRLRLQTMCGI